MTRLSMVYITLYYIAFAIFLGGFLFKIWRFAKTPTPLVIVGTPGAKSGVGTALRVASDALLFRSLFRGNKWIWVGAYCFHFGLLFLIFRHLRYFVWPLPMWYNRVEQLVGITGGLMVVVGIGWLLGRRFFHARTRYISAFSDYFVLFLLLAIAGTGLLIKFSVRTDIIAVKTFMLGLARLHPQPAPADPWFLLHFSLVLVLLVYFPFSKLMHAGGIFFSPTRNQIDWTRSTERRHVSPFENTKSA